jgi:hypothetical protein
LQLLDSHADELFDQREPVCALANIPTAALASAGARLQQECRKFFKSFDCCDFTWLMSRARPGE